MTPCLRLALCLGIHDLEGLHGWALAREVFGGHEVQRFDMPVKRARAIRTTQVLKEAAAVRPQLWPQIVRSAPPPQRCRSSGRLLGEAKVVGVRHVGTGAKPAK